MNPADYHTDLFKRPAHHFNSCRPVKYNSKTPIITIGVSKKGSNYFLSLKSVKMYLPTLRQQIHLE